MVRVNQDIPFELINGMNISYKETTSHENGTKWWEVDFVNGEKHGKDITWHENGDKFFKCDYVNGEKVLL